MAYRNALGEVLTIPASGPVSSGAAPSNTWRDRCRAQGGFPTVFPRGDKIGQPACRFIQTDNSLRYVSADESIAERITRAAQTATERVQVAAGNAVEIRDTVLQATGVSNGLSGVLSKITGIPRPLLIGITLLGAWSFLANAGFVSPLSQVIGGARATRRRSSAARRKRARRG